MRHFFPPIPPIRPWAPDKLAKVTLSVLGARSWLVDSILSTLFRVDNDNLSVDGILSLVELGVVDRARAFVVD